MKAYSISIHRPSLQAGQVAASTIFKQNDSPRVGHVIASCNIYNGQHRPHQKPGFGADARKVLGLENMPRKYGLAWIVG